VSFKAKFEAARLIWRSPVLSDAAKVLWSDLAFNWAFGGKTSCFPSQKTIGQSLGKGRTAVQRLLRELVGLGLLLPHRTRRGNVYELVTEIPLPVCAPDRLENKSSPDLEGSENGASEAPKTEHHEDSTGSEKRAWQAPKREPGRLRKESLAGSEKRAWEDVLSEDVQKEAVPNEVPLADASGPQEATTESTGKRTTEATEEPAKPATSEGKEAKPRLRDDAVEPTPAPELLTNTPAQVLALASVESSAAAKAPRRARRSGKGRGLVDLPDEHVAKAPAGSQAVPEYDIPAPPPLSTGDAVAGLLRDEIRLCFGEDSARGLLPPSRKTANQIKTWINGGFDPKVLQGMIRVLVWDWRVIRETVWPKQSGSPHPQINDLVSYADRLASAVTSGFAYPNSLRGVENTYADRYLGGRHRSIEPAPLNEAETQVRESMVVGREWEPDTTDVDPNDMTDIV